MAGRNEGPWLGLLGIVFVIAIIQAVLNLIERLAILLVWVVAACLGLWAIGLTIVQVVSLIRSRLSRRSEEAPGQCDQCPLRTRLPSATPGPDA